MEKLNKLVELAKKATPGEWSQSPYDTGARFCAQVWDSKGTALVLHDGKGEMASNDVEFIAAANPATILAIAEAFWALEQENILLKQGCENSPLVQEMIDWRYRAEAAEAKLAGMEEQEESRWNTHDGIARPIGVDKDDLVYLRMNRQEIKLPYPAGMVNWKHDGGEFDVIAWASVYSSPRPAPAVSLAELVPDAIDGSQADSRYPSGWNACRAVILRKIEEAK